MKWKKNKNKSGVTLLGVFSLELLFVHHVVSSALHVRKRGPLLPFLAHGLLHESTFFTPGIRDSFRRLPASTIIFGLYQARVKIARIVRNERQFSCRLKTTASWRRQQRLLVDGLLHACVELHYIRFHLELVDELLECVDLRYVFSHTLLLRFGQSFRSHELAVKLSPRSLLKRFNHVRWPACNYIQTVSLLLQPCGKNQLLYTPY